jgi:hypothetical protein
MKHEPLQNKWDESSIVLTQKSWQGQIIVFKWYFLVRAITFLSFEIGQ